ncbi:hypothetical protein CJU90_1267 [Yarrowia sp. C11]|nr:hypothetical protein CKK34_2680 [Yarrowia sp. E02]KAG5373552.1 hypothetical protein CJU90_1267 [Yarrowia sp. C11]
MPQDGQADGLHHQDLRAQHQARAHVADRLARRLSAPTDLIRQQYLAEETRETEKQGNGYRKSSDATILGGAVDRTASQCLSVSQPTASDAAAAQKIH